MHCRIFIPALLITATGALGQLAGCASSGQDQNYKMLNEDRPMFETRPDPSKPGEAKAPASQTLFVATAAAPVTQPTAGMTQPGASAIPGDLEPAQPDAGDTAKTDPTTITKTQEALAVPGVEHSITGLDRSHWPHVVVGPNLSENHLPQIDDYGIVND